MSVHPAGALGAMNHAYVWMTLGAVGGILFYSRFYVQWLASERAGHMAADVRHSSRSMTPSLSRPATATNPSAP